MSLLSLMSEALESLYCLFLSVSSISGFPPRLPVAEERKYIEKLVAGDRTARQKLIEHNLRLVAHVSKKYMGAVPDGDDLISIGTIGLIKAVDTFRPEKCSKFSSYAATCIQNEILMYLRSGKKSGVKRDGTDATNECTLFALRSTERMIITRRYGLDGRKPLTQREIAARLHISRSYVSRIEKRILEQIRSRL